MSLRSCGSLTSLSMALQKASAVGSHRKPVSPSATLSRGPPEFTAITGQQQYMDSTGTIPKCSLLGVYSTAALPRSRATFSESEGERRKREKQAGGSLGEQPSQAVCLTGLLVKGMRVEGGVEDICLDSSQTTKGLFEDACEDDIVLHPTEEDQVEGHIDHPQVGAQGVQPGPASSATNVGASSRSPSKTVAPRAAGSTVRQRKATSSGARSGGRTTGSAGTGGMWRFYTEDSPGLKVGAGLRHGPPGVWAPHRAEALDNCRRAKLVFIKHPHRTSPSLTASLQQSGSDWTLRDALPRPDIFKEEGLKLRNNEQWDHTIYNATSGFWSELLVRGRLDGDVSTQAVSVKSGCGWGPCGAAAAGTDSRGKAGKVATNIPLSQRTRGETEIGNNPDCSIMRRSWQVSGPTTSQGKPSDTLQEPDNREDLQGGHLLNQALLRHRV
ncbi:Protein transport protein Sec61 subunit beta [Liparis tanakae]|uniref:Protein transport protein Sec61 subunit beta n=1 Tax=Liparis tanakae TaxID=230148 RepID=A0A4Z2ICN3_9TELE|nr:Protein transport protein Sec61 subunit beta [Liparis tanakae]